MPPARIFYKSRLFVVGITLFILGLGNYLAAISKVSHYERIVADLALQIPQPQSFLLRGVDKTFPSETWERWEIARAKLDYYHVVLGGGQLMTSLGLGCLLFALMKIRRQRLRYAMSRRLASSNAMREQAIVS